jgi:hypothetical protein
MALLRNLALLLVAAGNLPFPAPKVIPVTDSLRCDAGKVVQIDAAKLEMTMSAVAGNITFKAAEAQVVGPDGRALGSVTAVRVGQGVRVYYVVDNGAIAKEIDVEAPRS